MQSNGTHSTTRSRPRPPRREFVTTICSEDLGRYAGVGLTLDQVIEEELRNVGRVAPVGVEENDDLVIWERNKIAALIRLGADGRPIVTRFDRPASDTGAPDCAAGKVPAPDVLDLSSSGPGLSPGAPTVTETRAAISHFQMLRRIAEEVDQRCPEAGHPGAALASGDAEQECWQRFRSVAREALAISELQLCRAIDNLATKVRNHDHRRVAGSRPPHCGVIDGGRLYLVQEGAAGQALVVIDLMDLFRLDPGRGNVSTECP